MLDDKELGSEVLANPLKIQGIILSEVISRIEGDVTVADPNSAFNTMLECTTSITSQFVNKMDRDLQAKYSRRAVTADDLYGHLSDYDYLNMVASPATSYLMLSFDARYLRENALAYNTIYQKITIPQHTQFAFGAYTFGLYYPIDIRINSNTGNIIVAYDATVDNPLYTLSDNTLDYALSNDNGIEWLTIKFPVYQFARTMSIEDAQATLGFSKEFAYTDQFYACRVFHKVDGKWVDLNYTFSETIYSPSVPTAKIRILADTKKVRVSIPQVYFTNDQIGSSLKVEVYSTVGELDETISYSDRQSITITYPSESDEFPIYSNILNNIPTISALVYESALTGGSDAVPFGTLKTLVSTGALYDRVPISPIELTAYMEKKGFTIQKYLDNITDRVYYGYRKLVGGNVGSVLSTTAASIIGTEDLSSFSSILPFSDALVTILPTTIYKYVYESNSATPLSDIERASLESMTGQTLADTLNNTVYVKSPFHVVVQTSERFPLAKTYNLNNPTISKIQFEKENTNMVAQAKVRNAICMHLNDGTGGYRIRLGVTKTSLFAAVNESDVAVYVKFMTKTGSPVYKKAVYIGPANEASTLHLYDVMIDTNYHITTDGYIESTNLMTKDGDTGLFDIGLTSSCKVYFCVTPSLFPDISQDYDIINEVPTEASTMLGVASQSFVLTLGTDLSDILSNNLTAKWNPEEYEVYTEAVYSTYDSDQYARDEDGKLIYEIVDGELILTPIALAGDIIKDSNGSPIIRYSVGEYRRDENGKLIVSKDRYVTYHVDMLILDYRLYRSENAVDKAYIEELPSNIMSYLNTLKEASNNLIEQTNLYFRPTRTLGNGTYIANGGSMVTLPLALSFHIKYYVSSGSITNTSLISAIRNQTVSTIKTHIAKSTISMTAIAEDLKKAIGDNVISIDVLGIQGDTALQTLIVVDGDSSPVVDVNLAVQDDGSVALEHDINIEFVTVTQ